METIEEIRTGKLKHFLIVILLTKINNRGVVNKNPY